MKTFLRIVRAFTALMFVATLLISWLVPPEDQLGRRPATWPDDRVSVRYTWGRDDGTGPRDADARPAGFDQPDVLMRGNDPTEWSSGTAFAVEPLGVLVTAKHVTDSCAQLALSPESARPRYEFAWEIVQHTRADVAVVRAAHSAPTLPLGDDARLERGATAFAFGYPSGVASALVGELMGRARGQGQGDFGWSPVMVWALVSRDPESEAPLGGISGGPLLDTEGRVVGVVIASGSERRPRFITTTVAPVLEALEGAVQRAPPSAATAAPVNPRTATEYGHALRSRGSVVSAICRRTDVGRRGR